MAETKTILLVEDDAIIAMDEASALRKYGYTPIIAYSAEKAIQKASEEAVDLVLMDIDLGKGKMDGTVAAQKILKEQDVPVVFLSSHTESEVVEKTKSITSYGYVVKNSGETVLQASIDMAFRLHDAYQEKKKSEKRHMERSLQENQEILNEAQEIAKIGSYVWDLRDDSLTWSKGMFLLAGLDPDQFAGNLGNTIDNMLHPDDRGRIRGEISSMIEQRQTWSMEFRLVRPDGEIRWLKSGSRFIFDEAGEPIVCIGVHHDITEQKEIYEQQCLNTARLESLLDLYNKADVDKDTLAAFALEESARLTGSMIGFINFLSKDETEVTHAVYTKNTLKQCCLPNNVEAFKITGCGLWSEAYRRREPVIINNYSADYPAKKGLPEGHLSFTRFISIPVFSKGKVVAVAALGNKPTDYNENDVRQFRLFMEGLWHLLLNKQAQELSLESERQKNLILNSTSEMVAYYDTDLRIIWSNRASAESVGLSMGDLVGKNCFQVWHGREEPCPNCPVLKAMKAKTPCEAEIETPDGRYWYLRGYPVMDETGTVVNLVEFGQDITEKKRGEEQLRKSLEEKNYLMKELNHRVKNNLIMINSLINLKAASSKEETDLSDLTHQIDAVRIVHEKLYQSEDVTHINIREYIQDILETVFSSFAGGAVRVDNSIPSTIIKTRTAVPLGLIINEMATNAIKHGFIPGKDARFTVTMEQDGDKWDLAVSNNGNPFPDTVGFDNPTTLGLRLISALVEQLEGEIDLVRRPTPVFTISFPGGG